MEDVDVVGVNLKNQLWSAVVDPAIDVSSYIALNVKLFKSDKAGICLLIRSNFMEIWKLPGSQTKKVFNVELCCWRSYMFVARSDARQQGIFEFSLPKFLTQVYSTQTSRRSKDTKREPEKRLNSDQLLKTDEAGIWLLTRSNFMEVWKLPGSQTMKVFNVELCCWRSYVFVTRSDDHQQGIFEFSAP